MTAYRTLDSFDVAGRTVLVRSDLNVPLRDGEVTDDFRISAALPTVNALAERGARVVVCSHLGRPEGPDPELSLRPVAQRMAALTANPVSFASDTIGNQAKEAAEDLSLGSVLVLENTRFLDGETSNADAIADGLAELADVFIQDAFGSVHRAHASTVGVATRVPSGAGLLLASELEALGRFLGSPERPFTVVLGGAKVSDKLGVVGSLLPRVDKMLIGGGMCFTLLAAHGYSVGNSLLEEEMIGAVRRITEGPHGSRIVLPSDIVVGAEFAEGTAPTICDARSIPDDMVGLDIGPDTALAFAGAIGGSGSVFWNGPMGVFEWEGFRGGTEAVAAALAECSGFTAVGGGDSAAAIRSLGLESSVSHLSTGGGAGLELLEGRTLPGVAVLERWVR